MDYFKKGIYLGLGFISILGITFAANTIFSVNGIPVKELNGQVSFSEFNDIIGTVKNIYNDNTNNRIGIGPGASTPSTTLDIDGNITLRSINNCNKLGTTSTGKFVCK